MTDWYRTKDSYSHAASCFELKRATLTWCRLEAFYPPQALQNLYGKIDRVDFRSVVQPACGQTPHPQLLLPLTCKVHTRLHAL